MSTHQRGRKHLRAIIAAIAVVGLGAGAYLGMRSSAAATPATPAVTTFDATASRTTLTTSVAASGTMQPAQESTLSFGGPGTVTTVNVAVGDKVTAGQPLAAIDPTDLQSAVDAAQASVDAAQADLKTAKSTGTDAAIASAKSTLKAKQNALDQANTALAAATLTAPFDGTVAAVNVAVGDKIGSSSGTGSGGSTSSPAAITIITADRYTVSVGVGSADIGKITKGMHAKVTPAGATQALDGTVTGVGVVATTGASAGSSTTSFPVTITLDQPQTDLYAGIGASAQIITATRDNVLVVSSQAITRNPDGTATVQKKQPDGTYVTTPVTTGDSNGGQTEITAGLADGDTVQITIVRAPNPATSTNARSGANDPGGMSAGSGGARPGTVGSGGKPSGAQSGQFSGTSNGQEG